MKNFKTFFILTYLLSVSGNSHPWQGSGQKSISSKTHSFMKQFPPDKRKSLMEEFGSEKRFDWHYFPGSRAGLSLMSISSHNRKNSINFLKNYLSPKGHKLAETIRNLEIILKQEETFGFGRDPLGFYLEIFGHPGKDKDWAFSYEGHHLSLNYTFKNNNLISFSPFFLGLNPSEIKKNYEIGPKKGSKPLAEIEDLAFLILNSLSPSQLKQAWISKSPIGDVQGGGNRSPPNFEKKGLSSKDFDRKQLLNLHGLVIRYLSIFPENFSKNHIALIKSKKLELYFSWYGARKPGVGHYYKIDSKKFVIQLANTQSDVSGNPANHLHALWMDR